MLKEKISIHKGSCEHKVKSSSQCGTESEHSMPSISEGEVKVKRYQSHSEHWNRGKCYLSMFCYEIRIETYKKYEIITIWMN